jgi:acetoin utilization deacetylase AcuC-like enzyme
MARTGLIQDDRFQRHDTGPGHPERPQRLAAIATGLRRRGLDQACTPIEFEPIDLALVRRNHDEAYIERVRRACASGARYIDVPDSAICPESFEIARLAAGAVVAAVDAVMLPPPLPRGDTGGSSPNVGPGGATRLQNAFCAVRPPGHHAERNLSMGFCLFNNIAIAARRLIEDHGLSRVLILDFDVHHGNGTQHSFESDPRVLFVSLHGHPGIVYPGTGYAEERGKGAGTGYTINIPILPPRREDAWRKAFDDIVIPAVEDYSPQFVLISAGFDAHKADPLAPLELETASYGWLTDELTAMAKRHCDGKLVSILEGGYDLQALGDSVALHVERLLAAGGGL